MFTDTTVTGYAGAFAESVSEIRAFVASMPETEHIAMGDSSTCLGARIVRALNLDYINETDGRAWWGVTGGGIRVYSTVHDRLDYERTLDIDANREVAAFFDWLFDYGLYRDDAGDITPKTGANFGEVTWVSRVSAAELLVLIDHYTGTVLPRFA